MKWVYFINQPLVTVPIMDISTPKKIKLMYNESIDEYVYINGKLYWKPF